jgi:hypothetical protein
LRSIEHVGGSADPDNADLGNLTMILSNVALLDMLNTIRTNVLSATGPALASVHLAKAAMTISSTVDPSTFTEADFDGYAALDVATWEPARLLSNGSVETVSSALAYFSPTGTTTPNTIYGFWVVAGDGTYLGAEAFATQYALTGPSTALAFIPTLILVPTVFNTPIVP